MQPSGQPDDRKGAKIVCKGAKNTGQVFKIHEIGSNLACPSQTNAVACCVRPNDWALLGRHMMTGEGTGHTGLVAALSELAARVQRGRTHDDVLRIAGDGVLQLGMRFVVFQIDESDLILRFVATTRFRQSQFVLLTLPPSTSDESVADLDNLRTCVPN